MVLLSQQGADSSTIACRFEMTDEFAKARREKLTPNLPVASNTWRGDIMPEKFLPATPELFIHQPVELMKVNRLERLEKLVGGVKKARLIL